MNWNDIGWKVEVKFTELGNRIRPADHIEILRPRLPKKYSPLLPDERGSQSVYLAAGDRNLSSFDRPTDVLSRFANNRAEWRLPSGPSGS